MDRFLKEARSLGLCRQYQREWAKKDNLDKYVEGVSWCMERDFPSLSDLRANRVELEKRGVYIDKSMDMDVERDVYIFHNCDIQLYAKDWNVCRVYAGNDSHIKLFVSGNAVVFVDNYGCEIEPIISDNGRVILL